MPYQPAGSYLASERVEMMSTSAERSTTCCMACSAPDASPHHHFWHDSHVHQAPNQLVAAGTEGYFMNSNVEWNPGRGRYACFVALEPGLETPDDSPDQSPQFVFKCNTCARPSCIPSQAVAEVAHLQQSRMLCLAFRLVCLCGSY